MHHYGDPKKRIGYPGVERMGFKCIPHRSPAQNSDHWLLVSAAIVSSLYLRFYAELRTKLVKFLTHNVSLRVRASSGYEAWLKTC